MTTDEMILALVERHGFVLPDGLYGLNNNTFQGHPSLRHHMVYDLCACEFARQANRRPQNSLDVSPKYQESRDHMADGNSVAAIEALYEALESK